MHRDGMVYAHAHDDASSDGHRIRIGMVTGECVQVQCFFAFSLSLEQQLSKKKKEEVENDPMCLGQLDLWSAEQ
jgi:hypothetical protein